MSKATEALEKLLDNPDATIVLSAAQLLNSNEQRDLDREARSA